MDEKRIKLQEEQIRLQGEELEIRRLEAMNKKSETALMEKFLLSQLGNRRNES
jgi:hypothetical protein